MDSLRWHTIRGHKLVLDQFRSKIYKRGIGEYMNFYQPLKNLDNKWFLGEDGKLNFEQKYKLTIFDTKQFYKELIQSIESCCDRVTFREIRLLKLTEDIYNRKKFEQLIIKKW